MPAGMSTPNLIADAEDPKAIDLSTGEELKSYGEYYGDLRFEIKEATPFTVWYRKTPDSTDYTVLLPDEDGYYTIPAVYEGSKEHSIYIEDTCGNKSYYSWLHVTWNYLIDVGEEGRYWETPTVKPLRISKTQYLEEELSKINIGVKSAHSDGKWMLVDVDWEIPETYDPNSPREQTFTVNGTVILAGTKDNEKNLSELDVVPRPGEEWKKNISVQVTVEGDPQYQVTVQDSENGSVTVVNATETDEDGTPLLCKGDLVMLSIAPDEGYMLSALSVNGTPAAVAVGEDTYTFTQPEENVTITATFEKRNEHTVTFDANGGSEPDELPEEVTTAMPAKKVLHGSTYYLPECEFIAPEGKQFKAWQTDGTEYPVHAPVTVTADITVKALWEDAPPAPAEFTITFDGNGGTPSVGSMTTANQKLTSLPSASRSNHSFDGWYTEKSGGTRITTDTVFSANTTVYAHWTYTGGGSSGYSYYTIKATAGAGGSISPSGNVSVREGRDQTFTITPDTGYTVSDVRIDGNSVGAVESYTFENVGRTHTIEVIFMKANGNPQTGVFVDVAAGIYYEDAVDWAVESGITMGTDDTHFYPDGICTREQAVTFLWRAAGSPEPETRTMPFTDVPVGSYYYDAVLWAVRENITKGTTSTTFSPDADCTRAQIVTFLWRCKK